MCSNKSFLRRVAEMFHIRKDLETTPAVSATSPWRWMMMIVVMMIMTRRTLPNELFLNMKRLDDEDSNNKYCISFEESTGYLHAVSLRTAVAALWFTILRTWCNKWGFQGKWEKQLVPGWSEQCCDQSTWFGGYSHIHPSQMMAGTSKIAGLYLSSPPLFFIFRFKPFRFFFPGTYRFCGLVVKNLAGPEPTWTQGFSFWTPDMWGRGKMNSDDADLFTFVSKVWWHEKTKVVVDW